MNDSPERDEWVDEVMAELDRRSGPPSERGGMVVVAVALVTTVIVLAFAVIGAITVVGWLT